MKNIYHLTWATHNSRISQRMVENKVRLGESIWLDAEAEVFVTQCLADIVGENSLECLAYNICGDHVHMVLSCLEQAISNCVRKMKGKSAQKYKDWQEISVEEKFHLWTRGFHKKLIISQKQLHSTLNYVKSNRQKHGLPINRMLLPIIEKMTSR